jgi:phosphoglycerol transferase
MRICCCQSSCPYPFSGFHRRLRLESGRNTWWFVVTLVVLGIFIVLNITLYASDYFTGDGINDAVLYTLTNSLTGAGVSKYILPGLGVVWRWLPFLALWPGYCAAVAIILTIMATACWRFPGAGLRRRQPGISPDNRAGKSQSRDGDPDFVAYYKEPSKKIATRSSTWSISTAKVWNARTLITMPSRT